MKNMEMEEEEEDNGGYESISPLVDKLLGKSGIVYSNSHVKCVMHPVRSVMREDVQAYQCATCKRVIKGAQGGRPRCNGKRYGMNF